MFGMKRAAPKSSRAATGKLLHLARKRVVDLLLLAAAGDLVEFWNDRISGVPGKEELEDVGAE
ncbi:hypothetical protein ACIBO5_60035 [Nonomuraea angiospora]|uniref:hypothetical protein n=1 Tax=Nonomuraea angiospora TaxID=46172 RepID=UPI0037A79C61